MPTEPVEQTDKQIRARSWDVAKGIELRLVRGLTYQEIADKLGIAKSTALTGIKQVLGLLDDPQANKAYAQNKVETLNAVERVMVGHLADPVKLDKASLNNVAYAFQQVHNARRLEAGLATEHVDVHGQYEAHLRRKGAREEAIGAIEARLVEVQGSGGDD